MINSRRNSNDLNGAGGSSESSLYSRNPVNEPGCYPKTARMKGSREGDKIIMHYHFKMKLKNENGVTIRGYRKRMFKYGKRLDPLSRVYEKEG